MLIWICWKILKNPLILSEISQNIKFFHHFCCWQFSKVVKRDIQKYSESQKLTGNERIITRSDRSSIFRFYLWKPKVLEIFKNLDQIRAKPLAHVGNSRMQKCILADWKVHPGFWICILELFTKIHNLKGPPFAFQPIRENSHYV